MAPLGTLLAALALLLVVAVVIVLPLLERKRPALDAPSRLDELDEERRAALRSIRELDEDFRTGKLDEADYRPLRAAQVKRGAEALREMDILRAQTHPKPSAGEIDDEIERRVSALRRTVRACPACGQPAHAGDRFCANCGAQLDPTAAP